MDIDNPYYNYIISFTVPDIDNVTVVDYDALEQRIYWSDVRTQTIKRAFINGTGVETVVSAGGCAGEPAARLLREISPSLGVTPTLFSQLTRLLPLLPSRPAQRSWPLCGLGFQKPLLDQLRRQQEADQRGEAGRLLQERGDPGAGQAPLLGGSPAPGVRVAGHGASRPGGTSPRCCRAQCPLPGTGNFTGQMGTTSAWPTWMAATALCSSPTRKGLLVRTPPCPLVSPYLAGP